MKHTIKLYTSGGMWVAKHSNPDIISTMGSDTIATPFFSTCPAPSVLAKISKLNPDYTVTITS